MAAAWWSACASLALAQDLLQEPASPGRAPGLPLSLLALGYLLLFLFARTYLIACPSRAQLEGLWAEHVQGWEEGQKQEDDQKKRDAREDTKECLQKARDLLEGRGFLGRIGSLLSLLLWNGEREMEAGMRKGVWYGLLTGLVLLLAACGGQPQPGLTLAPQPDLTLVGISPQNPAVVQGETVTLTLTFTSQNGFQGQVSSSVLEGGQPVSWLSPNAVQRNLNVPRGQQVQETLEVQVDPDAPTGSQNLTVRAAYGNQVTERALTLTVSASGGGGDGDGEGGGDGRRRPRGGFTISLSSDSLTVQQGSNSQTTLTVTPQNGFTGTVSLALVAGQDRVPQGLTLSPRSVRVSGTSPVNQSLTLSAKPATPTGTYRLKVRATSRRLTREADLTLTVSAPGGGGSPDFTISLNPTSLTVQQGSSSQTTLTVTPQNGFTGTVSLALVAGQDQVPQGLTLSPESVQVSGTSPVNQSLTLSAQSTTPTGTYRLKVRGTSGSLIREADLTVTVLTPYTNAYVQQVSGDGSVLVGSALVSGGVRPMVWRINAAPLSQGFYWLSAIAQQATVLDTGVTSAPYGVVLGVTADGQVGCGYGSVSTSASTGDRALAWDLTTLQPIPLPDHPAGGNVAYACAKSGGDIYIVGRVYPDFPRPTIWRNYAIWHQNTSVAYGIFHDITPNASTASAQLVYQGWVYDLNGNQYTQLVSSIGGAYRSRISPDGQAVAFSNDNSSASTKVWYGGNVYSVGMYLGAVRVRNGVAYVFGGDGQRAVRWRSDTQVLQDLNTVFASVLPPGVTLKGISAVSPDNRVIVGIAYNPATSQDEPFVLVGDPF